MNYTTIVLGGLLCTVPAFQDLDCDFCDDEETLYWAEGPQMDMPEDELVGWTPCFSNLYDEVEPDLTAAVLGEQCTGSKLLMACRPVGATNFQLLAMGERADVLFDVGTQVDGKHEANGVAWYYSSNFSWGFAAAGDSVHRTECDADFGAPQANENMRLCWHTLGGTIDAGWRCGASQNLNGSAEFERVIFHAD
ncbi:hypothetical protein [Nannocystis radixulma]|uniref:C-type lectin domain-containing protein n=1 Tax=Nannocystis radixulma TaxID=2995305 RepID=A0ABT5B4X4_9BACT|nr:hypothetical protein [Nannocystis radixulma]MDC0668528.1 hypothetical protein [Nannocystis radixulma]